MKVSKGQFDRITATKPPAHCIHTNEPVPEHVELLTDPMAYLGDKPPADFVSNDDMDTVIKRQMFDFRTLTLTEYLPKTDAYRFLHENEANESGETMVTYMEDHRKWAFYLKQVDKVEETIAIKTIDDWFYAAYRTVDSYIVIKHHCFENEPSLKPDYMVVLPFSEYGGAYELRFLFNAHVVFVVDKCPIGYGNEGALAHFRYLNMETGTATEICSFVSPVKKITDLWLQGPFLYIWEGEETRRTSIVDTLEGWSQRAVEVLDCRFYRTCLRGYTIYQRNTVVDINKRIAYEIPYDGEGVAIGLIDGEVHWWTFPDMEKKARVLTYTQVPHVEEDEEDDMNYDEGSQTEGAELGSGIRANW